MPDEPTNRSPLARLRWPSMLIVTGLALTFCWGVTMRDRKAEAAWERLMALGGSGVWDHSMVVVSLAETQVTDDDLKVFRDFPLVELLDLSRTGISGRGLAHLDEATSLEELILVGTKLDESFLAEFRRRHPKVKIVTEPPPQGRINPFTGEPL